MHQGNLFVDRDGSIIAVDFGIMGRLGPKEKRFLAEILYGFLSRDYRRTAQMHLDAGYVPARHSVESFAQALRSIGEPLMDRTAEEISMARLLQQLFEVTELFDMQTRPELLLLQKTMVVVEGVARSLDPRLNIWTAAEPVVKGWMEQQIGPAARINEGLVGVGALAGLLSEAPKLAEQARRVSHALAETAENGLHLDQSTIERMADAQAARSRPTRLALWLGALAMVTIAAKLWL
jgi:ubiquinone biosynthesis protein